MPKKKRLEVKITVAMPSELAEWLEDQVRKGVFANLSQGVRRCLTIVKEYMPELSVKIEKPEVDAG